MEKELEEKCNYRDLVNQTYCALVENMLFARGSAISAFRNPILTAVELASGINPEISANMRMFATATNFFLTGQIFDMGRKVIGMKIGIKKESSVDSKVWFNRIYGASWSLADIAVSYGLYKFFGAENLFEAGVPAIASVALTTFGGNGMLRTIDSFKDGLNVGLNGGRSYFSYDMEQEKKKKYVDVINIISLGGLAAFYWVTR